MKTVDPEVSLMEQNPDGTILQDYLRIASVTDKTHREELQREAAPLLERAHATKEALAELERAHGPWLRNLEGTLEQMDLNRFPNLRTPVDRLRQLLLQVLGPLVRFPRQIARGEEMLEGLHGRLEDMRGQAAAARFDIRNVTGSEAGITKKIQDIRRRYGEIPAHQDNTPIAELTPVAEPTESAPAPRHAESSFRRGRT